MLQGLHGLVFRGGIQEIEMENVVDAKDLPHGKGGEDMSGKTTSRRLPETRRPSRKF